MKHTCAVVLVLFALTAKAEEQQISTYTPPAIVYPVADTKALAPAPAADPVAERDIASSTHAQQKASKSEAAKYELPNKQEVERNVASEEDRTIKGMSRFQELAVESPQMWPWDK